MVMLFFAECCSLARCDGSTLGTFEKDATTDSDKQQQDTHSGHHHNHSDHDDHRNDEEEDSISRLVTSIVILGLGGANSWIRMTNPEQCKVMGITMRKNGDPTLPILRIETNYRIVRKDIQAIDLRSECGFGPLAVQYNCTRYKEQNPADALNISQAYGLYRMSFSSECEVDLGVGNMVLDGYKHTVEGSLTTPILYHPLKSHLGIEFRPAWSNLIQDYDLAALYTLHNISVKAGYRAVLSPHDSLSGPYVGLVCRL